MICVIPAAGKGVRLRPMTYPLPKSMVKINDRPLIFYVFSKIKELGVNRVIMIVNQHKEKLIDFLGQNYLGIDVEYVIQEKLNGIANAVKLVEPYVDKNFFVMLGDEIYDTNHSLFSTFVKKQNLDCSFCMMKTDTEQLIKNNYSIEMNDGKIIKLVEKPKNIISSYFGVGTYFFNTKIFDFINKTSPSPLNNEINLTDVMQTMIDNNQKVSPFFLEGRYVNVNSSDELERAKGIINEITIIKKGLN